MKETSLNNKELIERNALGSLLAEEWNLLERKRRSATSLYKSQFLSLFDTESALGNNSASFEEKKEGVGGGICMATLRG